LEVVRKVHVRDSFPTESSPRSNALVVPNDQVSVGWERAASSRKLGVVCINEVLLGPRLSTISRSGVEEGSRNTGLIGRRGRRAASLPSLY